MKIDLKPYWAFAEYIARERHELKKDRPTATILTDQHWLIGILGEITYSLAAGEPFDARLLPAAGDGGNDFPERVNVKASPAGSRFLIEYPDRISQATEYYVLCLIDMDKQEGTVKGWISREAFQATAETKDFGYGPRLAVPAESLEPPATFTPILRNAFRLKNQGEAIIKEYCSITVNNGTNHTKTGPRSAGHRA